MLQHLVFDKELSLVAELVAQVAEQGGGLVADLAGAQRLGDLGQRLELGADAERSATEVADMPQSRLSQVTTVALPSARCAPRRWHSRFGRERAFERSR